MQRRNIQKIIVALITVTSVMIHPLKAQNASEVFYSIAIKSIDNASVSLTQFKGKKIVIVVLPSSAGDTTVSKAEVKNLLANNPGIILIGIPALDAGYSPNMKSSVKTFYTSLPSNFILAEPMKVKRNAGDNQYPLFQWLTDKNKNTHFNNDVSSTGQKFFIDEGGELYSVFDSVIRLSHKAVTRAIGRTKPGK